MAWQKIPLGARVRHRSEGYEGWIDGWTDPDRTQCRIFIHQDRAYRFAAYKYLDVCNDIAGVMDVSKLDETLAFIIGREDFRSVPLFCTIWALGLYHARYMLKRSRAKDLTHTHRINSLKLEFEMEGWILGMGDSDEDDVGYFYNRLHPLLNKGFPIATVPTHDPDKPNWGLVKLVRRLSAQGRIDASSCLVRSETIIQQHKCKENALNRRDTNRHLKTIRVKNQALINSKAVLLLDDIVTTGTSLMACKKLLLDAGASEVICLAMGKAT